MQAMTMPARAPNPETLEKPRRRRHPAKFKLEILAQADKAGPGETAELLRKHGLYSSHLTTWRRARELGTLGALAKKRGPKADPGPVKRSACHAAACTTSAARGHHGPPEGAHGPSAR